jgi:DNA repair ATPase RecN
MIESLRSRINQAQGQKSLLLKQLDTKSKECDSLRELQKTQELVQVLIQTTAQETQDQLKIHTKDLVQALLDICFPEYEFCMEFVLKRGRTECDIFVDKDNERMDPMQSNGGGLVDIIALGLRIACLSLSDNDRVLILDEPLRFLSSNIKPTVAQVLKEMTGKLGIQVIMVTHDEAFSGIADKSFVVTQKRRRSQIEVN